MTNLQWSIAFFIAGFGFLASAIFAKRGRIKHMFILKINPARPVDGIYATIPLGISCILLSIAWFTYGTPSSVYLARFAIIGGIVFSFVFMAWKPRWLKPDWLLWLEEHYDMPTRAFMFEQARHEGTWSQRISTQKGLETWAEEMAQQYRSVRGYR
jgi:hypothetical protein